MQRWRLGRDIGASARRKPTARRRAHNAPPKFGLARAAQSGAGIIRRAPARASLRASAQRVASAG
eukprot:6109815-Pyramimonas_sp.AAC.1